MGATWSLPNRGLDVHVALAEPAARLTPVPERQLDILRQMEVPVITAATAALDQADLIVDALIGYSVVGDPTEPTAGLIGWAKHPSCPNTEPGHPNGLDVAAQPCGSTRR